MSPMTSHRLVGLMRQYVFPTFCSITSLLLVAGIWYLWQDIRTNEALNRERSQEFDAMLSTMVSGPHIRQELTRATDYVQRIDDNLMVESKLEENLRYFWKIQNKTQADILFLRQQNAEVPVENPDYDVIPFNLQLAGTYEQVASYMLELESGPKLAEVRSFSYRRRESGADSITLNIDLRVLGKR